MRREIIYKDVSPTAAQEASASMTGVQPFSDFAEVLGSGTSAKRWHTCEHNMVILNGTSEPFVTAGQHFGIWSQAQSDDDLNIVIPPLEITFSGYVSSTAFTLTFDDPSNTFCTELNLRYYRGSILLFDSVFFPDRSMYSCEGTVESYNKIVVQFKKLNFSRRYLRIQNILFGLVRTYSSQEIKSLRVFEKIDITGLTLPINSSEFAILPKDDDDLLYQKRQSIEVRFDGVLIAQHYIDKAQNNNFSNVDIVGVLDTMGDYRGGVYEGDTTAEQLIMDIVGGCAIIEIDASLRGIPIHGWLPIKKRRDALAMVQFAIGAIIDTSRSDKITVTPLCDTAPTEIPVSSTYHAPTSEFEFPHTGVELIEYWLRRSTEDTKLFEDETDGQRITVNFRNPVWTANIQNGTLVELHPNYAIIEGVSGLVTTLTGREFELMQTRIAKNNPFISSITEEKIYSVKDQYLVHQGNSQGIVDRLYDYYLKPNSVSAAVVLNGEKPGDNVTINLAHRRQRTGALEQVELIPGTKVIKAGVKLRSG